MLDRRDVTVELSEEELTTVSNALNSPQVDPDPQLFDTLTRMQRGKPVEARQATKIVDAVARTLSEDDTSGKRDVIRSIEDSLDWGV